MLNKFSFISYPVSNLKKSITFYKDLLGLKLLLKNDNWAEFNINGQRFAIHENKNNKKLGARSGATVYFEAKPIEAVVKDLKMKGIVFHKDIEAYPYGKLILFFDPDNNSLGLYEPATKTINNK